MTILAAIDIGTNSVKLLVGRVTAGRVVPILERARITRLGEGLHRTGRISRLASDRTMNVLHAFVRLAKEHGAVKTDAIGTSALRAAVNARAFLRRCPVPVRVISGEEEARLAHRAAGSSVTVDIGGGSAQIALGIPGRSVRTWSLPIGAVVLTERFLKSDPPGGRELAAMAATIRRHLKKIGVRRKNADVIGIGGTVAALSRLIGGKRRRFRFAAIAALADRLSRLTIRQREGLGLERGRADIIVAGAEVLRQTMARLGARGVRACASGLRHGVLIELASAHRR